MVNILAHIVGWIFGIALVLGILGLVLYLVDLIRFSLSKKGTGPLPWWAFWSALHKD